MLQHTQAEYCRNSILAAAPNTLSAVQLGRANVYQQILSIIKEERERTSSHPDIPSIVPCRPDSY
jgi:hypothetical protein